jgi:hypothetical protein
MAMPSKLAGHLNLQDLITNTIEGAREKIAAVEDKEKAKKLLAFEKKEHGGHIPSEKEEKEEKEKMSSAIDFSDPDEIEKLASALDEVGDQLMSKEADSVELGGEKPQGGTVLPTASPVGGKQNYGKDKSKAHNVPAHTPEIKAPDDKGAKTLTEDTLKGGHIPITKGYPAKGVLKVGEAKPADKTTVAEPEKKAAMEKCSCDGKGTCEYCKSKEKKSSIELIAEAKLQEKKAAAGEFKPLQPGGHGKVEGKANEHDKGLAAAKPPMVKKGSALDFIMGRLSKVAESTQGGMTLDSPSETGPKPDSNSAGGNDARSHIGSNKAAIDAKKVQTKGPQKRMLSEVLTEPALSKAHDAKVQENLRNASKGGVKIAAVKAYLQKIAEDPNDPRHEKLKIAFDKKKAEKKEKSSTGVGNVAPMSGTPTPNPGATSM